MNAPKAKEILQLESRGEYDGGKDDLRDAIKMAVEIIEFFNAFQYMLQERFGNKNNGKGDSE